jgi:pSer/pThr/pTyr-binding forkhead associated (FHA) protein
MLDDPDPGPQLVGADGRFPIALGRTTIGRDGGAGLRLGDPTVGRRHAELDATGAYVTLTDLQSTNGTWVNGRRLAAGEAVRLSPGDTVRLGSTQLRFAVPGTGSVPRAPVAPQVTVGQQQAEQLNNVMGDQYNQYVRTVVEQRQSFMREVAATRTRARRLIWLGFLLYVVGAGAFLWMILRFLSLDPQDLQDDTAVKDVWGQELGGMPIGFIGFAVAGVGTVVLIVGIALHVVASSRQRRAPAQPLMPPVPFHRSH